ncbi:MAG: ABC transporter ATP-binding protein [Clostridia bacterium]|nr:ABC transporter ATP-binding protein [Clostridia bacterium]
MEKVLECKNLNKKIGKKDILKNVSLEVQEGDILGFIGPNGAGKTTTIKLILGLQKITSGEVKINGYDIKKDFEKAIEKVGTIVENPDLYMYMSGLENLKIIARLYRNVDQKRVEEVIKLVGLENRIKDKVSKYSLGMRQRLGIAQAILHKPNLLILDEPTNGLDPEGIKQLRDLLTKLAREEKMAILISSHNLAELESFCNKVSIIQNGEIIETSTLEEAKRVDGKMIYEIELDSTAGVENILDNSALEHIKEDSLQQKQGTGDISKQESKNIEIIDSNILKIYASKEEIPEIVAKLVNRNKKIYKVCEDLTSLEDAFLKKTGGNVID